MDAGVHQLQGKAKGVKPSDIIALLQELYRERTALYERHKAVATRVTPYDANNAYQYVINREETHLSWLADALAAAGATPAEPPPGPTLTIERGKDAWKKLVEDDARLAEAFLAKWRPRVEALSNARHQTMLRLMLGEIEEQTRMLEQAATGQIDVLGHSDTGAGSRGQVGIARWIGD